MRFLFCCLLNFAYFSTYGQAVQFNQLKFSSEIEKNWLTKVVENKDTSDLITLFLVGQQSNIAGYEGNITSIQQMIAELSVEIRKQKTNEKKIKLIYQKIHATFFKKYELKSKFKEIFTQGTYNCLTATALYGYALDQLEIPYVVKNLPTHVYLIAYPNTDQIIIESTAPNFGYYTFSEALINRYLEKLKQSKIISEEEYANNDKKTLFEKYFFKDKKIGMKQLLGLYYYNISLYEAELNNTEEFLNASKKAYLLYPSDETEYVLERALAESLNKAKLSEDSELDDFVSLTKLQKKNKSNQHDVLVLFNRLYQEQLVSKSNIEGYKKSYEKIRKTIDSSALRNEMDFAYNYNLGWINYRLGNNQNGDKHMVLALELQPENAEAIGMLAQSLRMKLYSTKQSNAVLDFLNNLSKNQPLTTEAKVFQDLYMLCYLDQARNFYTNKLTAKGDEMLAKFEMLSKGKALAEMENMFYLIDQAYTAGAVEYFRIGNSAKCKKILQNGMALDPSNTRFKEMMTSFK